MRLYSFKKLSWEFNHSKSPPHYMVVGLMDTTNPDYQINMLYVGQSSDIIHTGDNYQIPVPDYLPKQEDSAIQYIIIYPVPLNISPITLFTALRTNKEWLPFYEKSTKSSRGHIDVI